LRHRWTIVLVLFLVFIVWYRWPLLKGMYYFSAGGAAPDTAVPWRHDFQAALSEASQSGKPVLIDFTASWCPPCQVMKREVWPDAEVGQLAGDRFVPVLIDVDQERGLAQRYGISTIPTVVVTDGTGRELRRAGFLSRDQMIRFLRESAPAAAVPVVGQMKTSPPSRG
jgi:protein disulfide-isomerase